MNTPALAGQDESPGLWIIGASGPTGQFACARLVSQGRSFLPCSRAPQAARDMVWHSLSLDDATAPCPAREILSLGPLDRLAGWLSRVETPGLRRVVALGSISVRTKSDSASADERRLASQLAAAEATLAELCGQRGFGLTVIRAALIWDAARDHSITPLLQAASRWRVLPIPSDPGGWRNPIHAADLAAICLAELDRTGVPPGSIRVLEAGGPERLRQHELLRRIATHAGALAIPVPMALCRIAVGLGRPHWQQALARWHQDQIAEGPHLPEMRPFLRDA